MTVSVGDPASLGRLIDQVYRDFCKVHPDNTSIEMLRCMLGAGVAGVQAMPLKAAFRFDYLVRSGFDPHPRIDGKIRELGRNVVPATGEVVSFGTDPAPLVVDFGALLVEDAPKRAYNAYLQHIGVRHCMMSSCLVSHDWRYLLFVARSPEQPAFTEEEVALLKTVIPHFRSALRARTRLIISDRLAEGCAAGLDKLGIGVLVLNAQGQPIEISCVAEHILSAHDGLTIRPHFGATRAAENRRLQELIRKAAGQDWTPGGVAMAVKRPSGNPSYELVIDALPCPLGLPRDESVAVYLRDRNIGAAQAIEAGLLQDMFGLTEAEAMVACAAADGRSAHEIAGHLGIRYNTVRAHFRSIFAKNGFSSRADLVQMVLNCPASLGAEMDPAQGGAGRGGRVAA